MSAGRPTWAQVSAAENLGWLINRAEDSAGRRGADDQARAVLAEVVQAGRALLTLIDRDEQWVEVAYAFFVVGAEYVRHAEKEIDQ